MAEPPEKSWFAGEVGDTGIPKWGVAVGIAAVVVAIAFYLNSKKSGRTVVERQFTDEGADTGLPGDSGDNAVDEYYRENPGSPSYPSIGITPRTITAPLTNVQWGRYVQDQLLGFGLDPTLVTNAIAKYLRKEALSVAEQAVIRQALQRFGAVPEGDLEIVTDDDDDDDDGTWTAPLVKGQSRGTTVHRVTIPKGYDWNAIPKYLRAKGFEAISAGRLKIWNPLIYSAYVIKSGKNKGKLSSTVHIRVFSRSGTSFGKVASTEATYAKLKNWLAGRTAR